MALPSRSISSSEMSTHMRGMEDVRMLERTCGELAGLHFLGRRSKKWSPPASVARMAFQEEELA